MFSRMYKYFSRLEYGKYCLVYAIEKFDLENSEDRSRYGYFLAHFDGFSWASCCGRELENVKIIKKLPKTYLDDDE